MKKQLTLIFKNFVFLLIICGIAIPAKAQKLLDNLTSQPTLAYSVRQIRTLYTGPAMRIRRDNDNQLVDVYFNVNGVVALNSTVSAAGGGVATSTLLSAWVGSNWRLFQKWSLSRVQSGHN